MIKRLLKKLCETMAALNFMDHSTKKSINLRDTKLHYFSNSEYYENNDL